MNLFIDYPLDASNITLPESKILQMNLPYSRGMRKNKKFPSTDVNISSVMANPLLGLGIKVKNPSPSGIEIGIYDGRNLSSFDGYITSRALNYIFSLNFGDVIGIAISLGRAIRGGSIILIIDGYDSLGNLISGGDAGDNLTPCKIPNG